MVYVGGELERRRVSPVPPATVGVRAARAAHGTGDRVCNSKSPECLLSRGVSVFTPRRSLTQRRDGAPKSASDPLSSQLWLPSWRARSCGFRDPGGPRCSRKGPRDRSADASGSAGFFCQQPVPARASAKAAMPAPVLGSADSCSSGCRRACLQTGDALATARLAQPYLHRRDHAPVPERLAQLHLPQLADGDAATQSIQRAPDARRDARCGRLHRCERQAE